MTEKLSAEDVIKTLCKEETKEKIKEILESCLDTKIKEIGFLNNNIDKPASSASFIITSSEGSFCLNVNSKIVPRSKKQEENIGDFDENTFKQNCALIGELICSFDKKENSEEFILVKKSVLIDFYKGYESLKKFEKNIGSKLNC